MVSAWVTTFRANRYFQWPLLGPIEASGLSDITCILRGGSVQSSREGKVPFTARRNQEEANGLRAFGVNLKSNAPETPSPGRAESTDLWRASSRLMSQTLLTN